MSPNKKTAGLSLAAAVLGFLGCCGHRPRAHARNVRGQHQPKENPHAAGLGFLGCCGLWHRLHRAIRPANLILVQHPDTVTVSPRSGNEGAVILAG